MLYYGRINLREGIDVAESTISKEYIICHYWFFNYIHVLKFQNSVCNGCHGLT